MQKTIEYKGVTLTCDAEVVDPLYNLYGLNIEKLLHDLIDGDGESFVFGIKASLKVGNDNKASIYFENYGSNSEMVLITRAEYDSLLEDSEWLGCLEAAGVDNWPGYYEAGEIQRESREDND